MEQEQWTANNCTICISAPIQREITLNSCPHLVLEKASEVGLPESNITTHSMPLWDFLAFLNSAHTHKQPKEKIRTGKLN